MRLYIVRHGETVENAARVVTGQREGLLSRKGKEEARTVAEGLRGEPICRIYSSDLARAVGTARIIGGAVGAGMLTEARLREQHFGEYEGRPLAALLRHMILTGQDFRCLNPPGGEGAEAFRGRIFDFLGELSMAHEKDSVVLVTHHGVIAAMLASFLKKAPGRFSTELLRHGMILLAEVDAAETLSLRYSVAGNGPLRWNVVWELETA